MEHAKLPQVGTHAEFVGALEGMIVAPGPGESAQPGLTRELRSYMSPTEVFLTGSRRQDSSAASETRI